MRPCDWHQAPLGKLLAAPKDGKPVTRWTDRDEALLDVTNAIRKIAQRVAGPHPTTPECLPVTTAAPVTNEPRSSNLRLRKTFTERDRDVFLEEAFDFMARLFENSLEEIKARDPGYETAFKRIDATKFRAAIYPNGAALARCQIQRGLISNGIAFSYGKQPAGYRLQ